MTFIDAPAYAMLTMGGVVAGTAREVEE